MRVIEKEMNRAIAQGKHWAKDNTQVVIDTVLGEAPEEDFRVANVYLHGHEIATVFDMGTPTQWYSVNRNTLRAWPTRTTMSRLRALGVDVCTRKGVVHLDGKPL